MSGYKYSGNHGVNSMLFLHSEENYDQFCLSYIFTHRDFDNGILGLAWTAEPGTSGGLCSRYTVRLVRSNYTVTVRFVSSRYTDC